MKASEAIREGYVPCVRCMRKYLSVAGLPVGLDGEAVTAEEALKESGGD
jgi:hypothetical protein